MKHNKIIFENTALKQYLKKDKQKDKINLWFMNTNILLISSRYDISKILGAVKFSNQTYEYYLILISENTNQETYLKLNSSYNTFLDLLYRPEYLTKQDLKSILLSYK